MLLRACIGGALVATEIIHNFENDIIEKKSGRKREARKTKKSAHKVRSILKAVITMSNGQVY